MTLIPKLVRLHVKGGGCTARPLTAIKELIIRQVNVMRLGAA